MWLWPSIWRHTGRHERAVNLTAVEVFRDTDQDLVPALRLHLSADNKHRHQSDGSEHHAVELWGGLRKLEDSVEERVCVSERDYAYELHSHTRTRGDVLAAHTHTHTHTHIIPTPRPCAMYTNRACPCSLQLRIRSIDERGVVVLGDAPAEDARQLLVVLPAETDGALRDGVLARN